MEKKERETVVGVSELREVFEAKGFNLVQLESALGEVLELRKAKAKERNANQRERIKKALALLREAEAKA